jgi:hypothetical protein
LEFRSLRGGALPLLSLPRTLWFLLLMQPSDSRFGVFVVNAVKDGDGPPLATGRFWAFLVIHRLFKNFPADHQLDTDFCNGFLDTGKQGHARPGAVCSKRALILWLLRCGGEEQELIV